MDKLISRKEAADLLGFKPNTIAKWAMTGAKLPVVKIGRTVRYRLEDVEDLIRRSTMGGASQNEDAVLERNDNVEESNNE